MTTVVDLGGTKIAAARVEGATVLERRQAPTPRDGRFESLVEAVAALVAGWTDGPVGIATTGLVRDGKLSATNPGTLPVPPDSSAVTSRFLHCRSAPPTIERCPTGCSSR